MKSCLAFGLLLILVEMMSVVVHNTSTVSSYINLLPEVKEVLLGITAFILMSIPLVLMEYLFPGTTYKRNYLRGIKFWAMYLISSLIWSKMFIIIINGLHIKPFLSWKIEGDMAGISEVVMSAFGVIIALFVFDFFYYWFHRTQHKVPFLWNFHKVHHSIDDMNCINSYHHVLEEVFRFPFVMMPITLLLSISTPKIIFLSAFITIYGQYIHSDTSINLGPFRAIFADNTIHRIHHSLAEEHFDKNFAAFFSVLDRSFGTYAKPNNRLPPVGLSATKTPTSIYDYLRLPFQKPRRL
jgi:sterol desaturase/sphingolipid hydroxylase (fatty acid hydroxylase superfamily)